MIEEVQANICKLKNMSGSCRLSFFYSKLILGDFEPKGKKFSVNPQDTEFIHQIL